MERLYKTYGRLLAKTDMRFVRYLFKKINWENSLIVIKGGRGVGKTTMLLQHIKQTFKNKEEALYASLDNIWFANHSILELAEYHYTHGGTHLFLDEVHKYKNWQREIKNIYDSYPSLHLVVTGSSMLKIDESATADLSRRHRMYTLEGLSFREYLELECIASLPSYSLEEILANHFTLASEITAKVKVLRYFDHYLQTGFYPFYREEGDGFTDRLQQVVDMVVTNEIPSVSNIEYDSVYKTRQLLTALAESTPYTLNISALCANLQTSRGNVMKLLSLMDRASLIRRIYTTERATKIMQKPEKILFANTNLMYCLTPNSDTGTMRETFLASQTGVSHKLSMPNDGDLLVDGKWLFEVGGKRKGFSQIKDLPDSYVAADQLEIGHGNKIPLWMFGLLY